MAGILSKIACFVWCAIYDTLEKPTQWQCHIITRISLKLANVMKDGSIVSSISVLSSRKCTFQYFHSIFMYYFPLFFLFAIFSRKISTNSLLSLFDKTHANQWCLRAALIVYGRPYCCLVTSRVFLVVVRACSGDRHVPEGEAVQGLCAAREGSGGDRALPKDLQARRISFVLEIQ